MQSRDDRSSTYGHNLDVMSSYSHTKSTRQNQSEVTIDIHVKYLKLKVPQKTVLRIVWSRGKKHAKTQAKILSATLDKAVFDEKFQINTLLELDHETQRPTKEKLSKMTVMLDKSMGETQLCEVEFNMADFNYGEYKPVKLYLKKCPGNDYMDIDESQCYLDIGLKGTRANYQMDNKKAQPNPFRSTKSMRGPDTGSQYGKEKDMKDRSGSSGAVFVQEIEKMKKNENLAKREHAREIQTKNTKINNLLTDLENSKTDLSYTNREKEKLVKQVNQIQQENTQTKTDLKQTQLELENKTQLNQELQAQVEALQLENQNIQMVHNIEQDNKLKIQKDFDQQINAQYNFNRFNVDYTADAAMYLLKDNFQSKNKKR